MKFRFAVIICASVKTYLHAQQKGSGESMNEKPKTFKEVEALVESGDVSVLIQEERGNETIFLICDHRRTYGEGEVYEVVVA